MRENMNLGTKSELTSLEPTYSIVILEPTLEYIVRAPSRLPLL